MENVEMFNKDVASVCTAWTTAANKLASIKTQLLAHFEVEDLTYADHRDPVGELLMPAIAAKYGLEVEGGKFKGDNKDKMTVARNYKKRMLDALVPLPGASKKPKKFATKAKAVSFFVNVSKRVAKEHRKAAIKNLAAAWGMKITIKK